MKKIKIITTLLILLSITLPTFATKPVERNYDCFFGVISIIWLIIGVCINIFYKNKKMRNNVNIILLILLIIIIKYWISAKMAEQYKYSPDSPRREMINGTLYIENVEAD